MRLEEIGETFVIRLVIRLECKDGHKTRYPSRQTIFCCASFKSHKEDSSSGRIMRLVPVFTLETNNQTNNECFPTFVQTHNASSSIKTANISFKAEFTLSSSSFKVGFTDISISILEKSHSLHLRAD